MFCFSFFSEAVDYRSIDRLVTGVSCSDSLNGDPAIFINPASASSYNDDFPNRTSKTDTQVLNLIAREDYDEHSERVGFSEGERLC